MELCIEAESAGVDYVLVITGGYFAGALKNNKEALKGFYKEVSEKSPVPVLIYNCECLTLKSWQGVIEKNGLVTDPGASGGIDLDSDIVIELAKECPNIVGIKLTYVLFTRFLVTTLFSVSCVF